LASEALAAGQLWVLVKSFTEKVHLKPRFKYSESTLIIVLGTSFDCDYL